MMVLLKAISDETRMKILTLLLKHNYCVQALASKLALTEATVSQHLKVLREAGLLTGKKRGYFMHYEVKRAVLHELAGKIDALVQIKWKICTPETINSCHSASSQNCCHRKLKRG